MNDTTKTTMQELLARWAEAEPSHCQLLSGYYVVDARIVYLLRTDTLEVDGLMRIQWAIQEAIAERGWYFELSYSPERGYETEVGMGNGYSDKNLAEAILAAYLQALESE